MIKYKEAVRNWSRGVLVTLLVMLVMLMTVFPPAFAKVPTPPEVQDEGHTLASQPRSAGCLKAHAGPGYKHPLQQITVKQFRELVGKEKDRMVADVLKRPDVQNVLQESGVKPDSTKARVGIHTLDDGNTLLAVAIPAGNGILAYYELAKTLAEPNLEGQDEYFYKSEAMLLTIDKSKNQIANISTSVNGRLVSLRHGGPAPAQLENCGNCTDIFNWTQYGAYCTGFNGDCVRGCIGVCGTCAIACAVGGIANPGCLACLVWGCPFCIINCCYWAYDCISCPTPP